MPTDAARDSFIELDGRRHHFTGARLDQTDGDWSATLDRAGDEPLVLGGQVDDDGRLRVDLRALDEALGALQGRPLTAYPGGQEVCAARLDLRDDGDLALLTAAFAFAWDRALDPPDASYPEPRRVRINLWASRAAR